MGIDSSSTNCGIAIFENGKLIKTENIKFPGTYSLDKLTEITNYFIKKINSVKPNIVIMEKPAPVRNSKSLTALNQVAGAIWATALMNDIFIDEIHNKVIKKYMNIKSKEDAIECVKKRYGVKVKTDHEADAVLSVTAYSMLVEQNGQEITGGK